MKWLLLALFVIIPRQYSFAICSNDDVSGFMSLIQQADSILALAKLNSSEVMKIKINLDGTGVVNIYQDEKGNVAGISLIYVGSEKLQEAHTISEMNNGTTIQYTAKPREKSPLVLSVKPGTTIDPSTGGIFQVTIKTEKNPDKFEDYDLNLKKVNNQWKVYNNGKVVNQAVIGVNIGITGWKRTFSSVTFN